MLKVARLSLTLTVSSVFRISPYRPRIPELDRSPRDSTVMDKFLPSTFFFSALAKSSLIVLFARTPVLLSAIRVYLLSSVSSVCGCIYTFFSNVF